MTVSFTQKQTLTLLGLISFPTLSVTPVIDWLLCFQLEPLSYQAHPPLFILLFLLCPQHPARPFFVCACGRAVMKSCVPVATGALSACMYAYERARVCVCVVFRPEQCKQ